MQDDEVAADIVQDSMMKLAEKYSDHPAVEFPFLFQRILSNTINDYHRRQKVRNVWTTLVSSLMPNRHDSAEDDVDPLEHIQVEDHGIYSANPADQLQRLQTLGLIEEALQKLPARQREAFLLRYWEEMDVAQTAAIMGCSEGSVKTHCSRAVHTLASILDSKGIKS